MYEAKTAMLVLMCIMKMTNNWKWPCLSFPSAAITGFWHYIWLQYLFFHYVYACGSVCGFEPLNVGANGDQKRTSGSPGARVTEGCESPGTGSRELQQMDKPSLQPQTNIFKN